MVEVEDALRHWIASIHSMREVSAGSSPAEIMTKLLVLRSGLEEAGGPNLGGAVSSTSSTESQPTPTVMPFRLGRHRNHEQASVAAMVVSMPEPGVLSSQAAAAKEIRVSAAFRADVWLNRL